MIPFLISNITVELVKVIESPLHFKFVPFIVAVESVNNVRLLIKTFLPVLTANDLHTLVLLILNLYFLTEGVDLLYHIETLNH